MASALVDATTTMVTSVVPTNALIAAPTISVSANLTSMLEPTATIAFAAAVMWTTTAITAGVSPVNTHPPGWGEPARWWHNEFSKKCEKMLNYVLLFPFILVGSVVLFIIGPLQYNLTKPAWMQAQLRRGMEARAKNVAAAQEEYVRGKKERLEERAQLKAMEAMNGKQ